MRGSRCATTARASGGERERFSRRSTARRLGRDRPGSGLGLALVRQIARHHGGEVRCVAAQGGGSVFEVALPLAREPA
jgi:signal transduction histidine kinase